ncbi:MAG: hypothetical protein O2819_08600 [Planctomycetota bacterium]|nr:hypothetical protein [Planctomycetota bacterium]MDA1105877.1 hypothetical protein [Planctomycetota bacterium]
MAGGAVAIGLCLGGCRGTVLSPSLNDSLRREIAQKDVEILALKARVGELETAVASMPVASVDDLEVPRVAGIRIGSRTGIDPDHPDILRVWIEPFDGRERFIQVSGMISIRASWDAGGQAENPASPIEVQFGPAQVREAWRGGPFGGAYAFKIPLQPDATRPQSGNRSLRVEVTLAPQGVNRTLTATLPDEPQKGSTP